MSEWTKTPPSEPGFYLVIPNGAPPTVAELQADEDGSLWWYQIGEHWEAECDMFDWFWPEPIEFPPLPTNTNTPDQAGA